MFFFPSMGDLTSSAKKMDDILSILVVYMVDSLITGSE